MNADYIPTDHRATITKLLKPGDVALSQMNGNKFDILHAAVGISGEADELLEAVSAMRFAGAFEMNHPKVHPDEAWLGVIPSTADDPHGRNLRGDKERPPGIDMGNIREELGDHLFYEGALRIALDMESLDENLTITEGLWPFDLGPLTRVREEGITAKQVLCELLDLHNIVAGRILDRAKKHCMYNKELDQEARDILEQLLFDDCYLIEQIAMVIGVTEEQLRSGNIEKLDTGANARYKDGYSDEAAQQRADKEAEVKA